MTKVELMWEIISFLGRSPTLASTWKYSDKLMAKGFGKIMYHG
jgi:hypothetical protein